MSCFELGGGKYQAIGHREPQHGEIVLYEHINYGGKAYVTCHDVASFVDGGLNDIVSSVKLGRHAHAALYEHVNFGGRVLDVKGDIPDLRAHNFNDIASSVKVHHHAH